MNTQHIGKLSLIGAVGVAALWLSGAAPTFADVRAQSGERSVKAYTTDREKGGVLTAKISWRPYGHGRYNGKIQGKYEDRQEDGYCVQGFKTGGRERVPLGATACPKGQSIEFDDTFSHVAKAAVEVCRVNNKTHQLANCSGWK